MPDIDDREAVQRLLKRLPKGDFEVVLRTQDGEPRVIKNHPLLHDLTPMPTLYWLVGTEDRKKISQLESKGFIKLAEKEVDAQVLDLAHKQYENQRDALISPDHVGPKPSGGVGGTKRGVKCLHAHYAWYLVEGSDPIGKWLEKYL